MRKIISILLVAACTTSAFGSMNYIGRVADVFLGVSRMPFSPTMPVFTVFRPNVWTPPSSQIQPDIPPVPDTPTTPDGPDTPGTSGKPIVIAGKIPTTQYVQEFFREYCKDPSLTLNNVSDKKVSTEEYVLSSIDLVNGNTEYAKDARPQTAITIEYLLGIKNKINCCRVPWAADSVPEMTSYVDEHLVWTDGTIPYGTALWGPVVYGQGRYICRGGDAGTIVSTDGGNSWDKTTTWSDVSYLLAYGDGRFFALNENSLLVSSDGGNTWDKYDNVPAGSWSEFAYGGGRLAAVGAAGASGMLKTIVSDDFGETWTEIYLQDAMSWQTMVYADNRFVAVGWMVDAPDVPPFLAQVAVLPDGADAWNVIDVPQYEWSDIAYGNGRFVIVSDCNQGGFCGATLYSDDGGQTWLLAKDAGLDATNVAFGKNRFVATERTTGAIMYSNNGIDWTQVDGTQMGYNWADDIVFSDDGNFIVVGTGGVVLRSDNGVKWTRVDVASMGNYLTLSEMVYGGGAFVAMDASVYKRYTDESNIAVYSDDGIHWNSSVMPKRMWWYDLNYVDGKFIVLGYTYDVLLRIPDQAMVAISSDGGKTWAGNDVSLSYEDWIDGTDLSLYQAGGRIFRIRSYHDWVYDAEEDRYVSKSSCTADVSSDYGVTWTRTDLPSEQNWNSFSYINGVFLAFGNDTIMTSENGVNWTGGVGGTEFYIVYGNGRFLAVGYDGMVATSTNGVDWSDAVPTELSNYFMVQVSYQDGKFIAFGKMYGDSNEFGDYEEIGVVLESVDGLNWDKLFDSGEFPLVTYGQNKIVLAGDKNASRMGQYQINGNTHSWAVGNGCDTDTTLVPNMCSRVFIGGVATCANSKCSCSRTHLISGDRLTENMGSAIPVNRKFLDNNVCNLQCASICADNAVNNTDGIQRELLCGK